MRSWIRARCIRVIRRSLLFSERVRLYLLPLISINIIASVVTSYNGSESKNGSMYIPPQIPLVQIQYSMYALIMPHIPGINDVADRDLDFRFRFRKRSSTGARGIRG